MATINEVAILWNHVLRPRHIRLIEEIVFSEIDSGSVVIVSFRTSDGKYCFQRFEGTFSPRDLRELLDELCKTEVELGCEVRVLIGAFQHLHKK